MSFRLASQSKTKNQNNRMNELSITKLLENRAQEDFLSRTL